MIDEVQKQMKVNTQKSKSNQIPKLNVGARRAKVGNVMRQFGSKSMACCSGLGLKVVVKKKHTHLTCDINKLTHSTDKNTNQVNNTS